ncbi:hypothetical protein D9613_001418 [Agrocybe pediades]|uniref:Uncharacterized protein n=1 Tax=Agrocybe pediades TaxID=84607 RepID=A0A8H4R6Z4_9AGAR|nr:hypothetical protein D9613_001418 [Agrocybe pediades]KAF9560290.1 hypothetical protein CPC08DRAFT_665626 [Agrocybe pediades]
MSTDQTSLPPPPSYVHTLYDETFRSRTFQNPSIMSMANAPNLIGRLEYHSPTTDGSFSICIAGGEGAFVSKALYESIPAEHRPTLDEGSAEETVDTLTVGNLKPIGSVFFPIILTNKETRQPFRIILRALVVPNLFMGMFIGNEGHSGIVAYEAWSRGGPTWGFNFNDDPDNLVFVQGC